MPQSGYVTSKTSYVFDDQVYLDTIGAFTARNPGSSAMEKDPISRLKRARLHKSAAAGLMCETENWLGTVDARRRALAVAFAAGVSGYRTGPCTQTTDDSESEKDPAAPLNSPEMTDAAHGPKTKKPPDLGPEVITVRSLPKLVLIAAGAEASGRRKSAPAVPKTQDASVACGSGERPQSW